jgi:hypothetical protein
MNMRRGLLRGWVIVLIVLIIRPAVAETNCQNMGVVAGMFAYAETKCHLPAHSAVELALRGCQSSVMTQLEVLFIRGRNTFDAAVAQVGLAKACSNIVRLMRDVEKDAKP